jgi:hypothetical protein
MWALQVISVPIGSVEDSGPSIPCFDGLCLILVIRTTASTPPTQDIENDILVDL